MVRRASFLVVAVMISLIVYAPILYAMVRRVMFRLVPSFSLTGKKYPVPDDLFGLPPLPRAVEVYGFLVSVWWVVLLWTLVPGTWLGFEIFYALRRRRRDKLGLCIECGYRLRSWRGCCPGCGARVGPGLPTRRYVLNMPRNG